MEMKDPSKCLEVSIDDQEETRQCDIPLCEA